MDIYILIGLAYKYFYVLFSGSKFYIFRRSFGRMIIFGKIASRVYYNIPHYYAKTDCFDYAADFDYDE